jgi:hypothetical protein
VEASAKYTTCPRTGEEGLYEKFAVNVETGITLTIWLTVLELALLVTESFTTYLPAVAKA